MTHFIRLRWLKTTVDDFVNRQNISVVDFLKIDVEGHEAAVLKGASTTISRDMPFILAEANDGSDELIEFLAAWKYKRIDRQNAELLNILGFSKQKSVLSRGT